MLEFIFGTLFGFGSFMLTLFVISKLQRENAESYNRLLGVKAKERFKEDNKNV